MLMLIVKISTTGAGSLSPELQPAAETPAALLLSAHCVVQHLRIIPAEAMWQPKVFLLNERISGFTHTVDYQLVRNFDGDYWRDGIWKRGMAGIGGAPRCLDRG